MKNSHKRLTVLPISLLLLLLVGTPCTAQDTTKTKRPKIGLVLSGGGAKGLAHIGAIKVLEEAGIVPDYIAGTSMGSIVGGLYALGYTADEISVINQRINWSNYLTNNMPLYKIGMDEKHDYGRFIGEFPIKGSKVRLPSGMVESQALWNLFLELTWPAASITNFDSLPIPFRCCASDIIHGKIKTFSSGSLPLAMRASMAIPAFFTPVIENDTTIYVDGGIGNNFPVDEVIKMGADIVIGVYVGLPEEIDPNKAKSVYSILMQTAMFSGIKDAKEYMGMCDILIIPDLKKYSTASFEQGKNIEKVGYEAALAYKDELKKLADSLNSIAPPRQIKRLNRDTTFFVNKIVVEGSKNIDSDLVIGKSEILPNSKVDFFDVNEAVNNIFGTMYFNKVTYRVQETEKGHTLVFTPQEKERTLLKAALQTNNVFGPSLILNYTRHNVGTIGSRFTTGLEISRLPRFKANFHQYIGQTQRRALQLGIFYTANEVPFYLSTQKITGFKEHSFGGRLELQYTLFQNMQAAIGGAFEGTTLIPTESLIELDNLYDFGNLSFGGIKVWATLKKNTVDRNFFPRKGSLISLSYSFSPKPLLKISDSGNSTEVNSLLNPKQYHKITADYERYISAGKNLTFMLGANAGITTGTSAIYDSYFIGGSQYSSRDRDVTFYGFGYRQEIFPNYAIVKAEARVRLYSEIYLMGRLNYMQAAEDELDILFDIDNPYFDTMGYGLGLGINTLFGPITVFGTRNTLNNDLWWYINAGFTF